MASAGGGGGPFGGGVPFGGGGGGGGGLPFTGGGGGGGFGLRFGAGAGADSTEGDGGDSVVDGVVGSAEVGCGAASECRSGAGDSAGADEGGGGDSVVGVVDSAEVGGRSALEAPSAFAAISESPLFCMTDHRRSITSRLASFCAVRAAVVLASSFFSCDSRAFSALAVLRDSTADRSILSLVRGPKKKRVWVGPFFCAGLFQARG